MMGAVRVHAYTWVGSYESGEWGCKCGQPLRDHDHVKLILEAEEY